MSSVRFHGYSRRQYKVSVTYRLPTVPYFKKTSSKTVPFYSAGRDAILLRDPNIGRSQVSSGFFFSVYTVAVLPAVSYSAVPLQSRLFLLFSSINRFSSGQVCSSPSTELFLLL